MMATVPSGDPNFRPRDHDWQDERSEKAKVEAEKVPKELEVSCEATGQNVVFGRWGNNQGNPRNIFYRIVASGGF